MNRTEEQWKLESCGCFMDALRAAFTSIRDRIRKRGVRQRRRNYRISNMQAMEKMDQERDRGLKERVRPEVEVAKCGSGWKPSQEDGAAMRTPPFQERHRPFRRGTSHRRCINEPRENIWMSPRP